MRFAFEVKPHAPKCCLKLLGILFFFRNSLAFLVFALDAGRADGRDRIGSRWDSDFFNFLREVLSFSEFYPSLLATHYQT